MGAQWWCPVGKHKILDYTIIDKSKQGIWWVKIKCNCGANLHVTKHGIYSEAKKQ